MKKIISSATLGGAPIYKSDLREIFNDEIWDCIEAKAPLFPDDEQGVIMNGCVITSNAGTPANFDITTGIIALDGEYLRLPAATNKAFPQFIAKKTTSYETRTFADGTSNNFIEIKEAELVSSAPVSGQYIIIADFHVNNRWNMPWTDVALINDWVATNPVQYKIQNGIVYLRGSIDGASATSDSITGVTAGSPSGLNCFPHPEISGDFVVSKVSPTNERSFGVLALTNAQSIERNVLALNLRDDLPGTVPSDFVYSLNRISYNLKRWTAADL